MPSSVSAAEKPVLRPTSQGWALAMFAGLALSSILWPGQPLVFTLGVVLLGCIALAMVLVPRRLKKIQARWLDPGPLHAGDDIAMGAMVQGASESGPITVGAWDPLIERMSFITDLPGVSPTATRVVWSTRFPRRGVYDLPPLMLRNEQPFGVLFAQFSSGGALRLTVRPALGKMLSPMSERLRRWVEDGGLSPEPGDDDVSHLRAYRPGDPMRRINWRASARARQFLVTQRQAPSSQHLAIVIDTRCRHERSKRFERLISAGATLIDHLIADGWTLSIHGPFAPCGVRGERDQLLNMLADVKSESTSDLASSMPRGEPCVVLTMDDAGSLPANTQALIFNLDALSEAMQLPRVEA